MPSEFAKFDDLKFDLSHKWKYVSVYDVKKIERLNIKGLRALVFTLINKGLNPYVYIERTFKKIKYEVLSFKITGKNKKTFRNSRNTLNSFLEID